MRLLNQGSAGIMKNCERENRRTKSLSTLPRSYFLSTVVFSSDICIFIVNLKQKLKNMQIFVLESQQFTMICLDCKFFNHRCDSSKSAEMLHFEFWNMKVIFSKLQLLSKRLETVEWGNMKQFYPWILAISLEWLQNSSNLTVSVRETVDVSMFFN